MPPQGSKTKCHLNGVLETMFQVQGKNFASIFHQQPKCYCYSPTCTTCQKSYHSELSLSNSGDCQWWWSYSLYYEYCCADSYPICWHTCTCTTNSQYSSLGNCRGCQWWGWWSICTKFHSMTTNQFCFNFGHNTMTLSASRGPSWQRWMNGG